MKLEPTSYYVNNIVPLKDSVKEFLRPRHPEEYDSSRKSLKCKLQGGVLTDIRYAWLCRGPKLEIVDTKSGSKIAAWSFGTVVHDFETFITCVTELPSVQGKLSILIIGLECEIGGGMICMFDINSSRVIRAIQIDDRVTSIHVVSSGSDMSFPGALRAMDGVLAIGTSKGKIILIDLCRQMYEEATINNGPEYVRDEMNVCHLIYLSFFDLNNMDTHKERSLNTGDHLALQLNEPSTSGVHFALHGPNGDIRLHANMEEVAISAIHYCPQLGSLLVGFNFGAFQLYNLLNVQLEYTSPVYEDCIPITHFAIQEPCDDPRAFCYIWVVYNTIENGDGGFPMAVMYALAYNTKDFLEGYGHLYQEFNSCSVRFQIELGAVPGFRLMLKNKSSASCTGARCISLSAYTKSIVHHRQYGAPLQDVPDEKLALCSIVWIAWNQNLTACETYLSLFDLNQWYKEQMPESTKLENDAASYMSCESLSELFGLSIDGDGIHSNLLDVRLDRNSLSPFVCPQRLEEHYYPAALAFQAVCIQECSNIVWLGNYGVQRHLLTQLEQAGPLRLLRPSDLFHKCISLGLTPLYTDVLYSVSTPLNIQREMILSVALEHQMIRWLCHCARDWSNGSQSMAGCTLDMLLDWAWQRANTLKFQSDKLCIPLFDHMGMRLDSNALHQLNHCTCQIKHLCTLFEMVVQKCTIYLNEQDIDDIKYQWRALQMITIYLEVLQWLLNVGLLPECPISMYPRPDEFEKMSAPYPVESLARFYQSRRNELATVHQFDVDRSHNNLLFIDNLIDIECNGHILHKQWECDGGTGTGLYPPPSLQAVLRAYLIEDIDIVHKHCLLIYLFLDLAMTLDQSQYKSIITHLIKFPAVFKLSPSIIKITQAFWQLDHGDFSTAMSQLLDPAVNSEDLKPWHHRIVLNALLLQGQHQHALLYQQVRKPPISNIQDIRIIITLLIVNNLLQEAFHFQRHNRTHSNEKDILKHFFSICDQMNQQASVLHLPLCATEEREFINYLKMNPDEKNKNFLVIYYLQRDRYGEAFEINDYLNNNEILKQGLIGQQDKHFRNAIVSGFKKTLPDVTQRLLDYCQKEKEKILCINVNRPVPMSVYVHNHMGQTKYKSTLIQASFQKAKETWSSKLQNNNLNDTPFISTPKIFKFSKERRDSSIIYPAILDSSNMENIADDNIIDEDVTPAKRIKLTPRRSTSENQCLEQFKKRLSCYNSDSLLSTPIVKRRSIKNINQLENSFIGTPPGILKVRSNIRHSISPDDKIRETSITPDILEEDKLSVKLNVDDHDDDGGKTITTFNSIRVSPRKPINRTPRPAVHFEERSRSRSRSSNESDRCEVDVEIQIDVHREQTPDKQTDSEHSSQSTDDTFYSPNSSISISDAKPIHYSFTNQQTHIENTDRPLKRKSNDSIQSRRSYKATTPIQKNTETTITIIKETENHLPTNESIDNETTIEISSMNLANVATPVLVPSNIVPRVSGRRSLSRQVLENNLFAKVVVTPPRMSTRLSLAKLSDSDKKAGVEVSYTKNTTSIVNTTSDKRIEETCNVKMVQKTDEFSTEKHDDTAAQVIKHVHNEMETKLNVTKVTEIIDDGNILSCASDDEISESEASHFYKTTPPMEKRYSVLLLSSPNTSEQSQAISKTTEVEQNGMEITTNDERADNDIEKIKIIAPNEDESDETSPQSTSEESQSEVSSQSSDVILIKSSSSDDDDDDDDVDKLNESSSGNSNTSEDLIIEDNHQNVETEDQSENEFNQNNESNDKQMNTTAREENSNQIEHGKHDEVLKDTSDSNMENINEENMDKTNELFINNDIEEMKNVEFVTEENEERKEQTKNTIELSENTIQSQDKKESSSIRSEQLEISELDSLENNVIQTEEKENQKSIVQTEENYGIDVVSPLEQNIIEISESSMKSDENEESSFQRNEMDVTEHNPLEQNIIEITETTMKSQENEQSNFQGKEMDVTEQTPLETINATEIEPQEEYEESIVQAKEDKDQVAKLNEIKKSPARRTRSASQQSESNMKTVINEASKTPTRSASTRKRVYDHKIEEVTCDKTPIKPTQRITRKRSTSTDIEESKSNKMETKTKSSATSVTNLKIIEEDDKPMVRTRRATSVDTKEFDIDKPQQKRGQSLEPELLSKRGMKRTQKSAVINEEEDLQSIPEKIEEYSSTHRLTRHQKSIMEKSLVMQHLSKLQNIHVKQIDPIKLLDKETFTGSPDKEEGQFRAISPASSISTHSSAAVPEPGSPPSTPKRKRGRPSLTATPGSSKSTLVDNTEKSKSPGRPRRKSFTQTVTTTPARTRRSSRTASHDQDDASSVISVSSVLSVPVVQLNSLPEKKIIRHRSLSPTAFKEDTTSGSQKKGRKSSRTSILSKKTDLSKISEETTTTTTSNINTDEQQDETKPKRGRPRKIDSELTNVQDTGLKKTLRRSSYKPLEKYLPEHAILKTRKTFKIRKFSRNDSP